MEPLGGAASVIAVAHLSAQVVSLCKKYYSEVKNAKSDIERLVLELQTFQDVLQKLQTNTEGLETSKLLGTTAIKESVRQCSLDLKDIKSRLELEKRQKMMKRFGFRALKWPFTSAEVNRVINILERHKSTINSALGLDQISLALAAERDQNLSKLSHVEGATFKSYRLEHEALCLADTRVDVLNQITEWFSGPPTQCIFWLNGMAGTGKSTITRTIAHTLAEQKRLGASFFFSRGAGDLGRTQKFFASIAMQLARSSETLKGFIADAVAEHGDISQQFLREQWKHLIFRPIEKLDSCRHEVLDLVIVIDALDECEGDSDVRTILQLLTEANSFTRHRIRIFLTSRPEPSIRLAFNQMAQTLHQDLKLHDLPSSIIEHDVSVFLRHEFGLIREAHGIPTGWPSEQDIEILVKKTGRLFIFAATACRFIGDEADLPTERLPMITGDSVAHHSQTRELDKVCIQVLKHCIANNADDSERAQQSERFRTVVGLIIALFDTLPTTALAGLLSTELQRVVVTLRPLHSVLHIPEHQTDPIRLLHPSFREFLFDKDRCSETSFWIDEKEVHRKTAKQCLHVMSKDLKRDICGLGNPGALRKDVATSAVNEHISVLVQYACRFWVSHLREAGRFYGNDVVLLDGGLVEDFFRTSYLFWLEALSLIGRIPDAIDALMTLQEMSKQGQSTALRRMIDQAKLTVSNYRTAFEDTPLQLYSSVLAFSPTDSFVRDQYAQHMPNWLVGLHPIQESWGPCLATLEGHLSIIGSLVYSPDGQLLASGSWDYTVRLWDIPTGNPYSTLDGHLDDVHSVAFSPDSKLIASGSADCTVRLWDVMGGVVYVFEGHSERVDSVIFSPDGQLVGSGSYDNTIKLWDIKTASLRTTLQGFQHYPYKGLIANVRGSVVFSPDSQLVVYGSIDNTVRLYETSTGRERAIFKGHSRPVISVACSPNGRVIASNSHTSIKLWDTAAETILHTFESRSIHVAILIFSPSGQLIASAKDDGRTIRIWETMTGALVHTLEGHEFAIGDMVFSPNGRFIASGSWDSTINIWDVSEGLLYTTFNSQSGPITTLDFLPDSCILASGSCYGTIRLWNATNTAAIAESELRLGAVVVVKFSPDGRLVASGSSDGALKIWDITSGALLCTFRAHRFSVFSAVFSTDGQIIASGSLDRTVKLWDTNGILYHTLKGHKGAIISLAFSPRNKLLASASHDATIRLWHSTTGVPSYVLKGHSGYVYSVAFSPDGAIASGSSDGTVRLWDASTGMTTHILEASDEVIKVAFSPNGRLIASGSSFGRVMLWDINSGQEIAQYNVQNNVKFFSFDHASRLLLGLEQSDTEECDAENARIATYSVDSSRQWILYEGKKVFWLPVECRPYTYDVYDNHVVLGSSSGRVTILSFKPGWSGHIDG